MAEKNLDIKIKAKDMGEGTLTIEVEMKDRSVPRFQFESLQDLEGIIHDAVFVALTKSAADQSPSKSRITLVESAFVFPRKHKQVRLQGKHVTCYNKLS